MTFLALPRGAITPLGLETGRAVNRPVAPRLERDLSFLATLGTHGREHLPLSSRTKAAAAAAAKAAAAAACLVLLSGRTALRAPAGLIGEALAGVEFLLALRKHEGRSAIAAG